MRLKIISDGTINNTKIVDVETGAGLEGVTDVAWRLSVNKWNPAVVILELRNVPVEIIGDLVVIKQGDNTEVLEKDI